MITVSTPPVNARAVLAMALSVRLDAAGFDADVLAHDTSDVPETKPRVLVQIAGVEPASLACNGARTNKFNVWVISAMTDPAGASDDADAALAAVLDILDTTPRTTWTSATRGVWDGTNPGYQIEVETLA